MKTYTVNAVVEINGVMHYPGETISLEGKFENEINSNLLIPLNAENPPKKGGKSADGQKADKPPEPQQNGGKGENTPLNGNKVESGKATPKPTYTAKEIAEAAKKIL